MSCACITNMFPAAEVFSSGTRTVRFERKKKRSVLVTDCPSRSKGGTRCKGSYLLVSGWLALCEPSNDFCSRVRRRSLRCHTCFGSRTVSRGKDWLEVRDGVPVIADHHDARPTTAELLMSDHRETDWGRRGAHELFLANMMMPVVQRVGSPHGDYFQWNDVTCFSSSSHSCWLRQQGRG